MHPGGRPRKAPVQPHHQAHADSEEFEVESIADERLVHGKRWYLVKWVGFPASENTWEPEKHLRHLDIFAEYAEKKRRHLAESHTVPHKRQRADKETRKVEAILGERRRGSRGNSEFFVKWAGDRGCTWEPRQTVQRLLVFAEYLRSRLPVADAHEEDENGNKGQRDDAPKARGTFPLNKLHSDILRLVLEQLPSHYRLRMASRVCKMWRRLALQCTHTIKLRTPRTIDRAASVLTALTRLNVSIGSESRTDSFCVPTTLAALSIRRRGVERHERWGVEPPYPSGLTELSLRSEVLFDGTAELLLANVGTLQTLELLLDWDWLDHLGEPLSKHFTSLSNLSVYCKNFYSAFNDIFGPFLSTHSSQLRSLSIRSHRDHSGFDDKAGRHLALLHQVSLYPFPALTKLTLLTRWVSDDVGRESICSLVAGATRLSELSLSCTPLLADKAVQTLCAPSLTSLSPRGDYGFFDAAVWPKLRSIDEVSIAAVRPATDFLAFCSANRYGGLVRHVSFFETSLVHHVLQLCRNLTSVSFPGARDSIFPIPATLRHLTKVSVDYGAVSELADFIARLAPSCPNLARVVGYGWKGISMERLWRLHSECPSLLYLRIQSSVSYRDRFRIPFSIRNLAELPFQVGLVLREDSTSSGEDSSSSDEGSGDSDSDSEAREREEQEAWQYRQDQQAERRQRWQPDIRLYHW